MRKINTKDISEDALSLPKGKFARHRQRDLSEVLTSIILSMVVFGSRSLILFFG